MDSQESSSQQSGLDSLRTVEFRQTLRGYHIDDVDEYLERVAVEVDALRDQMRVASDRLRQAAERIGVLEQQLDEAKRQPAQPVATMPTDDALQRTLQMAQRFVEQTQAEARSEAEATLSSAQERAGLIVSEAEERARRTSEDAQRQLREDVTRLEGIRGQLSSDVETIARHLESERTRLRSALGELASWVEETLQPASSLLATRTPDGAQSGGAGQPASATMTRPAPSPTPQSLASSRSAAVASPSAAGIPSPFQGSGPATPGDTSGQVSDRAHNALT
jgi:DivIVA domain-containing protein